MKLIFCMASFGGRATLLPATCALWSFISLIEPVCADPRSETATELAKGFVNPPASARPWVYWFPLDGNSINGITLDLEAMQRVGIGGVLYMETEQGTPKGPAKFGEDSARNPNGTLKEWPQWLLEAKPSPTGRKTFTSWRLWKKDSPLQESGLLGPVRLETAALVRMP